MPITIPYIKNQFKKSSDVTTNAISNTSQSNFGKFYVFFFDKVYKILW